MPGMVVFIMAKTEKDKTKRKIISYLKKNKKSIKTKFFIAMVVMLAIIAIILVDAVYKDTVMTRREQVKNVYSVENMTFEPCNDYETYKFISDYFKARSNLNYEKIFASFGRDYFKDDSKLEKLDEISKMETEILKNMTGNRLLSKI